MRAELNKAGDARLAAFYEARAWRPLWLKGRTLRPEARAALALLGGAAADGLDPARHDPNRVDRIMSDASSRDPEALARAEVALSGAYAAYVRDLRSPPEAARMVFTDEALEPPATEPSQILTEAAAAPDLAAHLVAVRRMNPVYAQLRAALADLRAGRMNAPEGQRARYEALLLANMARARQIPTDPGRRFILVDAASARLFLYEGGQVRESMEVVVGRPRYPTPMMAGVIRYAVYNPYWNIPVDLVRDDFAPRVLRQGVAALEAQRLEVLSDWSHAARPVDPASVDWTAVAAGRQLLRVRQKPGGDNMMGQVKLMLPNELGIYLHDTPHRWAFEAEQRTFSSGCVRLERADPLARRLLGSAAPTAPPPSPEHRIDLPEPVPVFITYFTAWPTAGGLDVRRDPYRRDGPLLAALRVQPAPRLAIVSPQPRGAPAREPS